MKPDGIHLDSVGEAMAKESFWQDRVKYWRSLLTTHAYDPVVLRGMENACRGLLEAQALVKQRSEEHKNEAH